MLAETDLAMIRRCRGDHSRLGYALMLCYLHHPGRPLRTNERPPTALVSEEALVLNGLQMKGVGEFRRCVLGGKTGIFVLALIAAAERGANVIRWAFRSVI
jgi:hypothetical protein